MAAPSLLTRRWFLSNFDSKFKVTTGITRIFSCQTYNYCDLQQRQKVLTRLFLLKDRSYQVCGLSTTFSCLHKNDTKQLSPGLQPCNRLIKQAYLGSVCSYSSKTGKKKKITFDKEVVSVHF